MANLETMKVDPRVSEKRCNKKHKKAEKKEIFSSAKERNPSFLIAHILNFQDMSKTRSNFTGERLNETEHNIQTTGFEDNLPSCLNTIKKSYESKHELNFAPQWNKAHEKEQQMDKTDFFDIPSDRGDCMDTTSVNMNLFSCPPFSDQGYINYNDPYLGHNSNLFNTMFQSTFQSQKKCSSNICKETPPPPPPPYSQKITGRTVNENIEAITEKTLDWQQAQKSVDTRHAENAGSDCELTAKLKKARKARTAFTDDQLLHLENSFKTKRFDKKDDVQEVISAAITNDLERIFDASIELGL